MMNPDHEYPTHIPGLRLMKSRDFSGISTSWGYQTTAEFTLASARQLLSELPPELRICYADPDRGGTSDLTFVFLERSGDRFSEQTGGHGHSSPWTEIPFESALSSFAASRLVRSPLENLESFTIQTIPEHQRRGSGLRSI